MKKNLNQEKLILLKIKILLDTILKASFSLLNLNNNDMVNKQEQLFINIFYEHFLQYFSLILIVILF